MKRLAAFLAFWLISAAVLGQTLGWTGPGQPFSGPGFLNYENINEIIGVPGDGGDTGKAFVLPAIDAPANSTIILAVNYNRGITTLTGASISDTLGLTRSNPVCTLDANNGTASTKAALFVQAAGAGGGSDVITVATGASSFSPFQYDVAVYQNLQAAAADGFLCTTNIVPTSSGLIEPGSFSPTTNVEHIIWNWTVLNLWQGSNSPAVTKWTPTTGYTLHTSSIISQYMATGAGSLNNTWGGQWKDASTNAVTDPSITATGETNATGDTFHSMTVALLVNQSGSAIPATGIHIVRRQHETLNDWTGVTNKMQVPFLGNLRVITTGNNNWTTETVTSSDGCVWTNAGNTSSPLWYAQNCSADPSDTITITGTLTSNGQNAYQVWDVQNAAASSFKNSVIGGGNCVAAGTNNAPTITPSGTGAGLTIAQVIDGTGPLTGMGSGAPSGSIFDFMTYTGITDGSIDSSGNAIGHVNFSSANTTQNWNWVSPNGTRSCDWIAAVFK